MILLIDNYDSFTWNLVQRIGELDPSLNLNVVRNDRITPEEAVALRPSHVIISPGPCSPTEAGVSNDMIRAFAGKVPLLGVCLGHQCIGHVFGGDVVRAGRLMHGKTSRIHHTGQSVFKQMPEDFEATRYHSLLVKRDTLPTCLEITATASDDESEIMGLRHRELPIHGVQFHPESILTQNGKQLLKNFLEMA